MTDLVPAGSTLTAADPGRERWDAELALVGRWLAEHDRHTRSGYADTIGWPRYVTTVPDRPGREGHHAGDLRDTVSLRNGVTWLRWCAVRGLYLFDATRDHVLAWVEDIRTTPDATLTELLSKGTRTHMVATVSVFYRWAVEEGHTRHNPVVFNRKKKGLSMSGENSPTRSLSRGEVARLQLAADTDPVRSVRLRSSLIVAMLFRVGMRVSELCDMTMKDVQRIQGVRVVWVTLKGGRRHAFKLPPDVERRLDAYLASRGIGTEVAVVGAPGGSSTPVIATATGLPVDRRDVAKTVIRLATLAGLDDPQTVTPHVGRHTIITAMREAEIEESRIQRYIGHLHGSTTARYGHHTLDLVNSPGDVVSALFEQEMLLVA